MRTYQEEELKSIYDCGNAEDGLPIFAKNVEANIAIQVDIWMIHLVRVVVHTCIEGP